MDRINDVLNQLESTRKINTSMLDVLNQVGFRFETWLRYTQANKSKRQACIDYLIKAIRTDLI